MVRHALEAVELTGVDAEVIDLRWLDRASLDWETIGESVRKTNAVLIVEQGAQGTSYGGWLADELQRRFFDWLDQPVLRVTGGEASPSISKVSGARGDRTDRGGRARPRRGGTRDGGALMATVVRMPEVLAGASEAAIQSWLVTTGQTIAVGRAAGGGRDREGRRRVRGRDRGHRPAAARVRGTAGGGRRPHRDHRAVPGNPPTDRTMRGTRPSRRSRSERCGIGAGARDRPRSGAVATRRRAGAASRFGARRDRGPSLRQPDRPQAGQGAGHRPAGRRGDGARRSHRAPRPRARCGGCGLPWLQTLHPRTLRLSPRARRQPPVRATIGRRLRRRPPHRHAPRDRSTAHREQDERARTSTWSRTAAPTPCSSCGAA